jgi:hypothetical protein
MQRGDHGRTPTPHDFDGGEPRAFLLEMYLGVNLRHGGLGFGYEGWVRQRLDRNILVKQRDGKLASLADANAGA